MVNGTGCRSAGKEIIERNMNSLKWVPLLGSPDAQCVPLSSLARYLHLLVSAAAVTVVVVVSS